MSTKSPLVILLLVILFAAVFNLLVRSAIGWIDARYGTEWRRLPPIAFVLRYQVWIWLVLMLVLSYLATTTSRE